MKNLEQIYTSFDDYLEGNLSMQDKQDLESQLENNQELAEEFAFYISTKQAAKELAQQEKKKQLNARYQSLHKDKATEKKPIQMRRWLAVAASVLLLVSALYFFFNNPTTDDLYAQFATHETIALTARSEATLPYGELEKVYNGTNYATALPLTEQILVQKPDDYDVLLIRGICLLEMAQYDKALQSFTQLQNSKLRPRLNHAVWYKSLTYLKMNQLEKCKSSLNEILQSPTLPDQAKAKELLNQL